MMTLHEILAKLQALGNDKVRKHNTKFGAGDNQYGVKMGDIRSLAKEIKTNHALALELWATGNVDAQFLAVLVMDPKALSAEELDGLVRSVCFAHVADWLISYVVKPHRDCEVLRQKWMQSTDRWAGRAGWSLTSGRVARGEKGIAGTADVEGLDVAALLDRLEREMPGAAEEVQWTMNFTLGHIGIYFAAHRERALAIGEKLGLYRDYPVSKGCTSPFAPVWIREMVSRQG